MMGALDMSLVGNAIIEPYASDFAIIATPYVYDDINHQERVFESGAAIPPSRLCMPPLRSMALSFSALIPSAPATSTPATAPSPTPMS